MKRVRPTVVLDTNVFVAAQFNPGSDAARILDAVRRSDLRMMWDPSTRRETRAVLERIPPLSWRKAEELFRADNRFTGKTDADQFRRIPDPQDRKFAALAHATGSILVSWDQHLLAEPHRIDVLVLTPSELYSEGWIDR